jgi:hypothetical protein
VCVPLVVTNILKAKLKYIYAVSEELFNVVRLFIFCINNKVKCLKSLQDVMNSDESQHIRTVKNALGKVFET